MNKIKCEKCGYTHNSIDDLQPGFKGMLTCYRCYANVCKKPEEMLIVTDKAPTEGIKYEFVKTLKEEHLVKGEWIIAKPVELKEEFIRADPATPKAMDESLSKANQEYSDLKSDLFHISGQIMFDKIQKSWSGYQPGSVICYPEDTDRAFALIKATDEGNTNHRKYNLNEQTYTKMQSPDSISDPGIYKSTDRQIINRLKNNAAFFYEEFYEDAFRIGMQIRQIMESTEETRLKRQAIIEYLQLEDEGA